MQQRRLSTAGGPDQGDPLTAHHLERGVVQCDDRLLLRAEGAAKADAPNEDFAQGWILPSRSRTSRFAVSATRSLWVTTRTALPSAARARRRSRTIPSVPRSISPVGS